MVRQFQVDVFIFPKIYIDLVTQLGLLQVNNTFIKGDGTYHKLPHVQKSPFMWSVYIMCTLMVNCKKVEITVCTDETELSSQLTQSFKR